MNLSGTVLKGRYCILNPVGKGGGGKVYLARDLELGVLWAVKEIPVSDKSEARMLLKLSHPSLPKMIDYIEDNTESSSNNTTANDSLYEEAVDQLQLILDKVNDPSGLTINKAEYAENTYLGEKIFMFDCSYTNEVGGIDRTKFACIDGTLYDEDPARPQGNMAYIQFWDKEDSTKLDAKKLMDMIK